MYGQLLRILPSPTLQVGREKILPLLCLVAPALVLFVVGTAALVPLPAVLAGVEMSICHPQVLVVLAQRLRLTTIFAQLLIQLNVTR